MYVWWATCWCSHQNSHQPDHQTSLIIPQQQPGVSSVFQRRAQTHLHNMSANIHKKHCLARKTCECTSLYVRPLVVKAAQTLSLQLGASLAGTAKSSKKKEVVVTHLVWGDSAKGCKGISNPAQDKQPLSGNLPLVWWNS